MKKRRGTLIAGILVLAFGLLALALLEASTDSVIIQYGIKAWQFGRTAAAIAAALGAALALAGLVIVLRARGKEGVGKEPPAQEAGQREQPALAMKGRLDGPALSGLLLEYSRGPWDCCHGSINRLLQQMSSMDACQERLHRLLESNDADALSNTEEIMDGVEQYMFRCIRKACNYMQAYSPSSGGGREKVEKALDEAVQANTLQLGQAQEFLGLIADFLNEQGMDQSGLDMLEIYKKTILESISQEPEEGLLPGKGDK